MKALLLPKILRAGAASTEVEMIARTGGDKIKVQAGPRIWAVYRHRLHSADGRRRITPDEFDALPWQGAGEDPKIRAAAIGAPLPLVTLRRPA